MNENLPPPYWSPTGNSGVWYWDESEPIGCWKWADDKLHTPSLKNKKKNWLKEIKNKIWRIEK